MSNLNHTSSGSSGGGIVTWGSVAIVFIVLKLLKVIDWSWLWVLSPIWIPIALLSITLIVVVLIGIVMMIFK